MTEWIEHDGGPQPVADDVSLYVWHPWGYFQSAAGGVNWSGKQRYRILNRHLIDAARLEGIRLGLDAAFRVLITQFLSQERGPPEWHMLGTAISTLDPETIAKEADQ